MKRIDKLNLILIAAILLLIPACISSNPEQTQTDNDALATNEAAPLNSVPSTQPTSAPDVIDTPVLETEDTAVSTAVDFQLTSPVMENGGILPVDFTCDGDRLTPPLNWDGAPEGTTSFALLMDHQPGPGDYHWYWVAFNISVDTTFLDTGAVVPGTLGTNSVDNTQSYAPPCSKDDSPKLYSFHLFALSAAPEISDPATTDRETLLVAINDLTLATASLDVTFDRANPQTATIIPDTSAEVATTNGASDHTHDPCQAGSIFEDHDHSVSASCANGTLTVETETGMPTHDIMRGITSWILRVPIPFKYVDQTAWVFPLEPVWLENHQAAHSRGPLAMAVNGVPLYHFDKRPDVDLGDGYVYDPIFDTVQQGELDHCGGHAGQGEDYHYHTAPVCLLDEHDLTKPIAISLGGVNIFFGTGGTDYYGEGRYNDINNLPDGELTECNGYQLEDGTFVYYTTQAPPYILGCFHEQIDLSTQIEARVMRELTEFGRDHVEVISYELDGTVRTLTVLTQSGNLIAIVYEPSAVGEDCWDMQFRTDADVAVPKETHCRVDQ